MERIKIQLTDFTWYTLARDSLAFGLSKTKDKPNLNGIANRIIRKMLVLRKKRREEIVSSFKKDLPGEESILLSKKMDEVFESVYFAERDDVLTTSLWIRPSKGEEASFEEIEKDELPRTKMTGASYVRTLLSEYARLPEYQRESILFDEIREKAVEALKEGKAFSCTYHANRYKLLPIGDLPYYYEPRQNVYLITVEASNQRTGHAFEISKIKDISLSSAPEKRNDALSKKAFRQALDGEPEKMENFEVK